MKLPFVEIVIMAFATRSDPSWFHPMDFKNIYICRAFRFVMIGVPG
jgi:hypothetical protein